MRPRHDLHRRRRQVAASLAGLVALLMGQVFAYSPIEVFTPEEILALYGLE